MTDFRRLSSRGKAKPNSRRTLLRAFPRPQWGEDYAPCADEINHDPLTPWIDPMKLLADHGHVETDEDAQLLRSSLAIVAEESQRLGLAVPDDEARTAALALRKDLALGLIHTPEAGRSLVPSTIETLRRIGLGEPTPDAG